MSIPTRAKKQRSSGAEAQKTQGRKRGGQGERTANGVTYLRSEIWSTKPSDPLALVGATAEKPRPVTPSADLERFPPESARMSPKDGAALTKAGPMLAKIGTDSTEARAVSTKRGRVGHACNRNLCGPRCPRTAACALARALPKPQASTQQGGQLLWTLIAPSLSDGLRSSARL